MWFYAAIARPHLDGFSTSLVVDYMSILLETTAGNVVIDVDNSSSGYNFVKLAQANYFFFAPFYGLKKDTVVVSGDPEYPESHGRSICAIATIPEQYGQNEGGYLRLKPGYTTVADEQGAKSGSESALGVVFFVTRGEIASQDPTVGSTFAISLTSDWNLLRHMKNLVRVGRVAEGFPALDTINTSAVDDQGHPLVDIRITNTHILHDPFPHLEVPKMLHEVSATQLRNLRIGASPKAETGPDHVSSAAIALELLGDLPHYNVKPSPHTLFIAKLNPVTDAASVASLFLRYGTVKGVTIIAGKTYGFVELASITEADRAYAALQDVVVDGRRIVVDYSQSTKKQE